MNAPKIIIPGSHVVESVSASFIADKVVEQVKAKYGNDFPCTLEELDAFFAPKKDTVERYTSLSFSKKKDKFRDMMCDLFFDLDGYQAFKGIWKNAFTEALETVEQAINTLPETMYFSRCDNHDILVALVDENIDLSVNKHAFNDARDLMVDAEDEAYMEGWRNTSSEEDSMICMAFMATNIAVDAGDTSCGSNSGFGCMDNDIEYINDNYGLGFIGDYSNYYCVSGEEQAVMIIEAKRPSSFDEVKAEFTKRLSLI